MRAKIHRRNNKLDMKSSARKSSRSFMGNLLMGIVLFILGFLFFFPVIYMFNQA